MKYTVEPAMKWVEVFNRWQSVVGGEQEWDKEAISVNQAKAVGREMGASPHTGMEMDYLEMIPVAGQQPPLTREHLEKYLQKMATSCPLHPMATLVTQMVEAFYCQLWRSQVTPNTPSTRHLHLHPSVLLSQDTLPCPPQTRQLLLSLLPRSLISI